MIGQELGAGMDTIFTRPASLVIDHSSRPPRRRGHLIAAQCVGTSSDLAVAEVRFIRISLCHRQPVAELCIRKTFPGAAARTSAARGCPRSSNRRNLTLGGVAPPAASVPRLNWVEIRLRPILDPRQLGCLVL